MTQSKKGQNPFTGLVMVGEQVNYRTSYEQHATFKDVSRVISCILSFSRHLKLPHLWSSRRAGKTKSGNFHHVTFIV